MGGCCSHMLCQIWRVRDQHTSHKRKGLLCNLIPWDVYFTFIVVTGITGGNPQPDLSLIHAMTIDPGFLMIQTILFQKLFILCKKLTLQHTEFEFSFGRNRRYTIRVEKWSIFSYHNDAQ